MVLFVLWVKGMIVIVGGCLLFVCGVWWVVLFDGDCFFYVWMNIVEYFVDIWFVEVE